jgi:molecular chaperone GrpE
MTKKKVDPTVNEVAQVSHEDCEKQLSELKSQMELWEGKYRRALADYQNLERQVREDQSRFARIATQLFVEQMLTPFDHLKLAAAHLNDKGLNLVIAQFKQLFESQGLKEIEALGKQFDPMSMEAVEAREGDEDKVLEVMQPGFELNGVVVRPAKVVVGKKS